MALFCKNCGVGIPQDALFCSTCGTPTGVVAPASAPGTVRAPLMRAREGRQVAGVCLGFSRAYGWDVLLVRILTIITGIFIFPVPEIAYVVAWLAMPEEPLALPTASGVPPPGVS